MFAEFRRREGAGSAPSKYAPDYSMSNISNVVQCRAILTIAVSNYIIYRTMLNDCERLPTHISRSRHYFTVTMSGTARDTNIVTIEYKLKLKTKTEVIIYYYYY